MAHKLYGLATLLVAATLYGCGLAEQVKYGTVHSEYIARPDTSQMLHYLPAQQTRVATYDSCTNLEADIKERVARQAEFDQLQMAWIATTGRETRLGGSHAMSSTSTTKAESSDGAADSDAAQPAATADRVGNIQEDGVAEADQFSVSQRHIFVEQRQAIRVIDRESLEQIGSLPLIGNKIAQLFATPDRLIIIGGSYGEEVCRTSPVTSNQPERTICSILDESKTVVSIYDVTDKGMPKLLKQHTYAGDYRDARLAGNRLVIVDQQPLFSGQATETISLPITNNAIGGVPCASIAKSSANDMDLDLTMIRSFDTANVDAPVQTSGMLGAGQQLYMTEDALYVAKSGLRWNFVYQSMVAPESAPQFDSWYREQESLVVSKFTFDRTTGAVALAAMGKVDGRVKDQWSFKQLAGGLLAVMTSTGMLWSQNFEQPAQNHLWVLKQDAKTLTVAASVKNFGTDEEIKAVRYVGPIAYAVTFRETDPLFAFDLSDPLAPKLLGELVMPGFSSYLHPVEGDRMLGIGDNNGLQMSLFNVADPTNLQQVDVKILSGGMSEAQYDHHAFYYDADRLLFAIPFWHYDYENPDAGNHSGALLYRIEGEHLVEAGRISHAKMGSSTCGGDIRRVMQLDGRLITISDRGIMENNPDDFATPGTGHPFADVDCPIECGVGYGEDGIVLD